MLDRSMNVDSLRFLLIVSLVVLGLTGCNKKGGKSIEEAAKADRYQYTQLHLGVQVRILVFAEKQEQAIQAATAAFDRIKTLEDVFSNYRQQSELNLLTTKAYNKWERASEPLFFVLNESLVFSEQTQGAFDITLGPLINLWKDTQQTLSLPLPAVLEEARQQTGWQHIQLDSTLQSVRIEQSGLQLDLGGIAKGYILDEALAVLTENGIQHALIEAGGDIVVSAPPPGKPGWEVTVPFAPADHPILKEAAALQHKAIATSGDTEQFLEINGVRYSHIVDPTTGLGTTSRRMATVIAPNGIMADKFATALTVMDTAAADSLLKANPDVLAYIRVLE